MADEVLVTHCSCTEPSHMMLFLWLEEEKELYISVQLNQLHSWWKRIWIALGYVLGKRSRYSYGHWDEGCISQESARELMPFLGRSSGLAIYPTTGTAGLATSTIKGGGITERSRHS